MSQALRLKWDNFQENTSLAFGSLRDDKDFSDVTLACEDGMQVETHKIILAGASPFFEKVLKRNRHNHPLIYLKGVKLENLQAVMDFIYYGETNVTQDYIDSFLDLAKDLKVKGLMSSVMRGSTSKAEVDKKPNIMKARHVNDEFANQKGNADCGFNFERSHTLNSAPQIEEEKDVSIDNWSNPNQEPSELDKKARTTMPKTAHKLGSEGVKNLTNNYENDLQRTLEMSLQEPGAPAAGSNTYSGIEDWSHPTEEPSELDKKVNAMMTKTDHKLPGPEGPGRTWTRFAFLCTECGLEGTSRNVKKHIEAKHIETEPLLCDQCEKTCKTRRALGEHKMKYHAIKYQ